MDRAPLGFALGSPAGFDRFTTQADPEFERGREPLPENLVETLFAPVLARVFALQRRLEGSAAYSARWELWAGLLAGAGVAPVGDTSLVQARTFAKHSLLVATARILIGRLDEPAATTNALVDRASDGFQGWLAEAAPGRELLNEIAACVCRHDWRRSTGDVLKGAYHELIEPEGRKALGEFYTPDALAKLVVEKVLDEAWCDAAIAEAAESLEGRNEDGSPPRLGVLDPSCGSGTFLFHAARRLSDRIRQARGPLPGKAAEIVALLVHGIDVHPVAAEMARATLAMALPRSASGRLPRLRIVRGDAMQTHALPIEQGAGIRGHRPQDAALFRLAQQGVGRLVGNPPWLVSPGTPEGPRKDAIEQMGVEEGVQPERRTSAKGDLASVFTARATRLYLSDRPGMNRYGWVLPGSALISDAWKPWRSGHWSGLAARHAEAWNLDDVAPPIFPRAPNGTCVVLGERAMSASNGIEKIFEWRGPLEAPEVEVLTRRKSMASLYQGEFRLGALSKPQPLLLAVDIRERGGGLAEVRTKRGTKAPWRDVELRGVVEASALLPVVRSQELRAFTVAPVCTFLIAPRDGRTLLDLTSDEDGRTRYPRTAAFWDKAESVYQERRTAKAGAALARNLDYKRTLSAQLARTGTDRRKVLYNASGNTLRAARVPIDAVGNEKVYWAVFGSEDEALYLCGVLNARCMQDAWREGRTSAHDFHKSLWRHVPVPKHDPASALHGAVVEAARKMERSASEGGWRALDRSVRAILPEYATA